MTAESAGDSSAEGVVILNPTAGSSEHAAKIHERSGDRGFDVRETAAAGDAIDLARGAAADGATLVAAAGGDGTVNEVVRGVDAANALDRVTVGVVPCGTGNDFAGHVGVTGIEEAFDVLDGGARRRVDLGIADDRPFVNSCVGGLTAEASAETESASKSRLGSMAYVLNTLRTLADYDGIRVSIEAMESGEPGLAWSGTAEVVLVGNGRCFPSGGSTQADMEDGRFEVTLVRDAGSIDLMETAAVERLLGRDTSRTVRFEVPSLDISVDEGEPIAFSLDGEIIERRELSLRTRPGALRIAVGDRYEPTPER